MAIEAATSAFARAGDLGIDPELDARLVRQMIGGSQEALAALYDRHSSAVFAAAMRASGDRWIAAEVVQETFLALWDRAELFDRLAAVCPGGWRGSRAIEPSIASGRLPVGSEPPPFPRLPVLEQTNSRSPSGSRLPVS